MGLHSRLCGRIERNKRTLRLRIEDTNRWPKSASSSIEKIFQFFTAAGMAKFPKGFCFDLTNPLTGHVKLSAHFFKRTGLPVVDVSIDDEADFGHLFVSSEGARLCGRWMRSRLLYGIYAEKRVVRKGVFRIACNQVVIFSVVKSKIFRNRRPARKQERPHFLRIFHGLQHEAFRKRSCRKNGGCI